MLRALDIALSLASSSLRFWNGTSATRSMTQPETLPVLFDREGDPDCRVVREALTELDLNVTIAPCPIGGKNIALLRKESGSQVLPRLYDPNTERNLIGKNAVLEYLFEEYAKKGVPSRYNNSPLDRLRSSTATMIRLNRGVKACPARPAEQPLTLYSFESSPYSRPVRERLCELELPYVLINLGKQQWADMGPAKPRLTMGPYRPLPGTKREAFFEEHGNVQVPYLIDPNTNTRLFESEVIIQYLNSQYAA